MDYRPEFYRYTTGPNCVAGMNSIQSISRLGGDIVEPLQSTSHWSSDQDQHSNMGSRHGKYRPQLPPPPPPIPTQQQVGNGSQRDVVKGQQSTATKINPNEALSPSPTNLLSSQEFKDELIRKQSRLSPQSIPDGLTIDERIKLRREAENRSIQANPMDTQMLPDKLISSSSKPRDKRPFAYSSDVNDPNNRGKLDLSQIKSSTMRRRLLVNMQSSSSCDDDPEQSAKNENSSSFKPGQNQIYAQSQSCEQDEIPSVWYSARPPIFYDINQMKSNGIQTNHQRAGQLREDYLSELDAEIAESLDNLSILVDSFAQPTSFDPQHTRSQPSRSRVSTFLPPGTSEPEQQIRPSFYSVLPSGRKPTYY